MTPKFEQYDTGFPIHLPERVVFCSTHYLFATSNPLSSGQSPKVTKPSLGQHFISAWSGEVQLSRRWMEQPGDTIQQQHSIEGQGDIIRNRSSRSTVYMYTPSLRKPHGRKKQHPPLTHYSDTHAGCWLRFSHSPAG
ncbi:hypothetical protein PABG_11762 [Paracoccidioides brasiliensis Pb03]|nr:hypothetical protein PABG_11762 [Paracoccidioides brasiliensis Pb03]